MREQLNQCPSRDCTNNRQHANDHEHQYIKASRSLALLPPPLPLPQVRELAGYDLAPDYQSLSTLATSHRYTNTAQYRSCAKTLVTYLHCETGVIRLNGTLMANETREQ